MSVADEFKLRVTEHLEERSDKLVDLLKHLVSFPYVREFCTKTLQRIEKKTNNCSWDKVCAYLSV